MKKVFLFPFPKNENFDGYHIDSLDPSTYFSSDKHGTFRDMINGGMGKWNRMRNFGYAHEIDTLYRTKNKGYMHYIRDFLDKFKDFDIFVMSAYNPIHPEIIYRHLKDKIKVLGFIDDPYSSYRSGIPYLWAFDGAFYISTSYNEDTLFEDQMSKWGVSNNKWHPLAPKTIKHPNLDNEFFYNRSVDLVYIGNYYGHKMERLIKLKKHFGTKFQLHGRWPLKGYAGAVRGLFGKPFFYDRITGISEVDRQNLYFNTKIGLNMHMSPTPTETGNMRMYETPYHGMMQICDKAGVNAHEKIYTPDTEAIYYDNTDEAIDLIEYYLTHDEERVKIAKAGFERTIKDYNWENNLKELLDWASGLKKNKS
ncbi:glycosyltransferase [Sulfurimonas sp.]|nr:glycosyltransferase [Sulfurimonas sp.]